MDPVGESIVEGVGNEVLVTVMISLLTVVVLIAWYSTNITATQSRLPAIRIDRRVVGVTLNRLPGSSSTEAQPSQAADGSGHADSQAADTLVVGAQIASLSNAILPDAGTAVAVGVISDVTGEATAANNTNEPTAQPTRDTEDTGSGETTTVPATQPSNLTENTSSGETTIAPAVHPVEDVVVTERADELVESTESQPTTSDAESDLPQQRENTEETVDGQEEAVETSSTPLDETDDNSAQSQDDQTINIRLKFLEGEDRLVTARKTDTVESFKRTHFAAEMQSNKLVRLIFNGQVLQDRQTLHSCNISNNTAIHALITETTAHNLQQTPHTDIAVFNAGVLMVPLFSIILALLWYLRYEFDELFNITSTFSLTAITAVFIFCVMAQRRAANPTTANRQRNYGINISGNNIN